MAKKASRWRVTTVVMWNIRDDEMVMRLACETRIASEEAKSVSKMKVFNCKPKAPTNNSKSSAHVRPFAVVHASSCMPYSSSSLNGILPWPPLLLAQN